MKRVVIVGTGFAALTAVRALRARDPDLGITVVGSRPEFVYYPSLVWIPSGLRRGADLVVPLENFFRRMRVEFHAGQATGLSDDGRILSTDNGEVGNDGLIIGSGGRFIKKLPGIEHAITPCEGIPAAEAIGERLRDMRGGVIALGFSGNPKEPSAMRGGPMFEFLFGIDTQLRREGRREQFRLIFFNPALEPGNRLGPKAAGKLLQAMSRRGIETRLGHKIRGFEADKVVTEGGTFGADLILFMPGMTGNIWFDKTTLPRSPGGLVQADAHCRVAGMDKVYVAGDSGSFPGPDWMPKQAHMADLQAEAAAHNLLAEMSGGSPDKTYKVELACMVDDSKSGLLVMRTSRRMIMLPPLRALHWAKRAFERWYMRKYR